MEGSLLAVARFRYRENGWYTQPVPTGDTKRCNRNGMTPP